MHDRIESGLHLTDINNPLNFFVLFTLYPSMNKPEPAHLLLWCQDGISSAQFNQFTLQSVLSCPALYPG